jgi:hypothetical protein
VRSSGRAALLAALLVATLAVAGPGEEAPDTEAAALEEVPESMKGLEGDFVVEDVARIYLRSTLSDFINGGAARYLGYTFRWVAVWDARSEDRDVDATIELYCFTDPTDALGIYLSGSRGEGEDLPFERSQVRRGLLKAQKGPYFIRALVRSRGAEADQAARALGKELGEALPEADTPLPPVLQALPEDDRRSDSLRYFHTKEALDAEYYLGDENLLILGKETRCGLAKYEPGEEGERPGKLVVVVYPDRERAAEAAERFAEEYLAADGPEPGGTAVADIEDGGIACITLHEELAAVALCLDFADSERASELAGSALTALEEEMAE